MVPFGFVFKLMNSLNSILSFSNQLHQKENDQRLVLLYVHVYINLKKIIRYFRYKFIYYVVELFDCQRKILVEFQQN